MILLSSVARRSALSPSQLRLVPPQFSDFFSTMTTSKTSSDGSKYFTVGLTGASGLVGTALRDELTRQGRVNGKPVRVVRLIRSDQAEQKDLNAVDDGNDITLKWNPKGSTANEILSPEAVASMDAIVHLSGENVATGLGPLGFAGIRPWTDAKKKEIIDSRVITTKALANVVAASPKPKSFLVASGIGAYGDNFIGDVNAVDESVDISQSKGFLAEVSRLWEEATLPATKASKQKHRVVNMRFGVVMSTKGGALAKLYPIFFLGGGGLVGSGRQCFSFISARDHARAIVHTLESKQLSGPVNFCAPQPCTNKEFTEALGKAINRPTLLPLPEFAVSLLFGEMGNEMLLGGTRALPGKLLKSGFKFGHPTIADAIASALKENI
ncbi:hypothetical protein ACA910_015439 [Epithemia clementina (nom. ined.)]